jgi:hypothetical protein
MEFSQNVITKNFISAAKSLKDRGNVDSYDTLATSLGWNKTSMSSVMNGRRNVPNEVYKKFADKYKTDLVAEVNPTEAGLHNVLLNHAMLRVTLMALAELLAKQRKLPVTKIIAELEAAVNEQTESLLKRLKQ